MESISFLHFNIKKSGIKFNKSFKEAGKFITLEMNL